MLSESDSQLAGAFAGRYRIPKNARMAPKVSFSFEGPVQPGSSKYTFTAADGSKGEVELIRSPGKQNALEVIW